MSEVSEVIWMQMGANRFRAMTGAKPYAIDNGLGIRFPKARKSINYVKITLNSKDLYDMKFIRLWGRKVVTVEEVNDVYADQLQSIFTRVTGLNTHL